MVGDVAVPFDGKRKSRRCFDPPFFKRALRLKSIKRVVNLDRGEALGAEPEPLFLWRVAIKILAPPFVIPPAGADVNFPGHFGHLLWHEPDAVYASMCAAGRIVWGVAIIMGSLLSRTGFPPDPCSVKSCIFEGVL